MKSILQVLNEGEDKYPYVGISAESGRVIIFTKETTGTIIHDPTEHYTLGRWGSSWSEDSFDILKGQITLSN